MVAFETLLLGLVIGHVPIRLMVSPPATAVDLRLDGKALATLRGAPWELQCDFGPDVMPHWLTAVALDASGREIGRASRAVNMGRKLTDVSLLLERDPKTRAPSAVRVAWNAAAVGPSQPVVTAALDGVHLRIGDQQRIELPHVDLAKPHVVSIEVSFSEALHDRADLVLGGDVAETAASDLMATAVTLAGGKRALEIGELRGVFRAGPASLEPVAVDYGRAEVAVVLSAEASNHLASAWWAHRDPRRVDPVLERLAGMRVAPPPDADVFFLVPGVLASGTGGRAFFAMGRRTRLSWLRELAVLSSLSGFERSGGHRLADAVAVAGAEVAASNHRRAVILLLAEADAAKAGDGRAVDASAVGIPAARAYLAALRVPLIVWSLTGARSDEGAAAWGSVRDVSDGRRLRDAAKSLEARLAAQRIVWFAGRHLPQTIALSPGATGVQLAGKEAQEEAAPSTKGGG